MVMDGCRVISEVTIILVLLFSVLLPCELECRFAAVKVSYEVAPECLLMSYVFLCSVNLDARFK